MENEPRFVNSESTDFICVSILLQIGRRFFLIKIAMSLDFGFPSEARKSATIK